MHPTRFDHGVVLAQTPAPGVPITEEDTPQSLLETLGPLGAAMLVQSIKDNLFIPPHHDVSQTLPPPAQQSHAPKISPADREINWAAWDAEEILLRDRVLGRLWDGGIWARTGLDEGKWESKQKKLRATFTGPWSVSSAPEGVEAGTPFLCTKVATGAEEIRFATRDGKAVVPASMTQESGKKDQGIGLLIEQIKEHES